MDVLQVLVLVGLVLLIPTGYAAWIGAPFAPTLIKPVKTAFSFLNISEKDFVVDLGAGNGKILLEAQKRGARVLGYELSPIMWAVVFIRLHLVSLSFSRRGDRGEVKLRNFYTQKLPEETTIVFLFLMPKIMPRVHAFLAQQNLPNATYVLSYAFPLGKLPPYKIIKEEKCAPLYVYNYRDILPQ